MIIHLKKEYYISKKRLPWKEAQRKFPSMLKDEIHCPKTKGLSSLTNYSLHDYEWGGRITNYSLHDYEWGGK